MRNDSGEGIYMPGANIEGQGIAIGAHASASVVIGAAEQGLRERGNEEVANLLRTLQEAVERESARLDDPEEVQEAVKRVAEELASAEKPNKLTVRSLLSGIAQVAATATAVSGAALALADAVQRIG